MAPTLEILRAKKTDLFKAEGTKSIQGVIDILNKTDGHIASYVGTEVQDSEFWYAIIVWESVAHHQALIDNKELYPILVQALLQGAAKVEFMYHAILSTSTPQAALEAPLTEVLFWNLKEGTDKEEFKKLEHEFGTKVLPSDAVKNRGGFGPVVEDERKISVVLGWDGIEDFKKTIATPWASEYIQKLKALADLDLKHVVFEKDTSKA